MLPERVRLQPKFSGAKTLAFADYWRKNKIEQLESYQIKNHTGLMISEEELLKKPLSDDQSNKNRFSKLKQMDYLIGLNWTE